MTAREPASTGPLLVSRAGFAEHADVRLPDEFPNGSFDPHVDRNRSRRAEFESSGAALAASLFDGAVVWVRTTLLDEFVELVLPLVRHHIVLVSGDDDDDLPGPWRRAGQSILRHPFVVHWWVMNHDGSHPDRVSPIPVGMDFGRIARHPDWGEPLRSREEQDRRLIDLARSSPRLADRLPRAFGDFAPALSDIERPGRRFAEHVLGQSDVTDIVDVRLSQTELWKRRLSHAVVISPRGLGIDCHRTWEALVLGHIVVTLQSSIDPLFDGLPVEPLTSWSDVTAERITDWQRSHRSAGPDTPTLTIGHWMDRIRASSTRRRVALSAAPREPVPRHVHHIGDASSATAGSIRSSASWRVFNPTWTFSTWTNDDGDRVARETSSELARARSAVRAVGARRLIDRMLTLHAVGGLSVDAEIECITPWNRALERFDADAAFVCAPKPLGRWSGSDGRPGLGLVIARRGAPFILRLVWAMIERATALERSDGCSTFEIEHAMGVPLLSSILASDIADVELWRSETLVPRVGPDSVPVRSTAEPGIVHEAIASGGLAIDHPTALRAAQLSELPGTPALHQPGFVRFAGRDSSGDDIEWAGRDLDHVAAVARWHPDAVAFNTDGFVKRSITALTPIDDPGNDRGVFIAESFLRRHGPPPQQPD